MIALTVEIPAIATKMGVETIQTALGMTLRAASMAAKVANYGTREAMEARANVSGAAGRRGGLALAGRWLLHPFQTEEYLANRDVAQAALSEEWSGHYIFGVENAETRRLYERELVRQDNQFWGSDAPLDADTITHEKAIAAELLTEAERDKGLYAAQQSAESAIQRQRRANGNAPQARRNRKGKKGYFPIWAQLHIGGGIPIRIDGTAAATTKRVNGFDATFTRARTEAQVDRGRHLAIMLFT